MTPCEAAAGLLKRSGVSFNQGAADLSILYSLPNYMAR